MAGANRTGSADLLRSRGISPSQQRVKILDNLQGRRDHPRVEQVYSDLIGDIPTLSRTTVYNTLKLFAREQLVQEVMIDGGEIRYDFDTSVHGHFRCEHCGAIMDIFDKGAASLVEQIEKQLPEGTEVRGRHVYLIGRCPSCTSGIDSNRK